MNKYLQDLIALSKFDTSISQFDPKIENQKAKLAVFVETAEALKVSINSVYLEIDELKSKRTKNNIHLAELKTKLDQIAKKNKEVTNEKELKAIEKDFSDYSYRNTKLTLYKNDALKIVSKQDETLSEFKIRLQDRLNEKIDEEVDKLQIKFQKENDSIENKL